MNTLSFGLEKTEVIATNAWFGSRLADEMTAGTMALDALYSRHSDVTRMLFDCSQTVDAGGDIAHFDAYRRAFVRIRAHLERTRPARLIALGGGCAAAIATIPYLHSVHPSLRVVWIDAHFDLNTPATSTSHYIHGMTTGILTDGGEYGRFFSDSWNLNARDLYFCGQTESDPYEREFLSRHSTAMLAVSGRDSRNEARTWVEQLADLPVFVHLDLDVLRPDIYLNPKRGSAGGLDLRDLSSIISTIAQRCDLVGYSIAENAETDEVRVGSIVDLFPQGTS